MGAGISKSEINKNLHDAAHQLQREHRENQRQRRSEGGEFMTFNGILAKSNGQPSSKATVKNAKNANATTTAPLRKSNRKSVQDTQNAITRQLSKNKLLAFTPSAQAPQSTSAQGERSGTAASTTGKLPRVSKSKAVARTARTQLQPTISPGQPPKSQTKSKPKRGRPRNHSTEEPTIPEKGSGGRKTRRSLEAAKDQREIPPPGSKKREARTAKSLKRFTKSGEDGHIDGAGGSRRSRRGKGVASGAEGFDHDEAAEGQNGDVEQNEDADEEQESAEEDEEAVQGDGANDQSHEESDGVEASEGDEESVEDEDEEENKAQSDDAAGASNAPDPLRGEEIDPVSWYGWAKNLKEAEKSAKNHLKNRKDDPTSEACAIVETIFAIKRLTTDRQIPASSQQSRERLLTKKLSEQVNDYIISVSGEDLSDAKIKEFVEESARVLVPHLITLLYEVLFVTGSTITLTPQQLETVVVIAQSSTSLWSKARKCQKDHTTQTTVDQPIINAMGIVKKAAGRFEFEQDQYIAREEQARERVHAMQAYERRQRREEQEQALEVPLKQWRQRWQDLHTNRRDAEMANRRLIRDPKKVAHLRDTQVEDHEVQPALWIAKWKAREHQRQNGAPTSTEARPPNLEEEEVDANGTPIERTQLFGERTTPVPRSRTQHRRTASGAQTAPQPTNGNTPGAYNEEVRIPSHEDMYWTLPEWDRTEDAALLDSLSHYTGPAEKLWKHIIYELCRSEVDRKTGGYINPALYRRNVCEIVARGVWLRDYLWSDWSEQGLPVEEWEWVRRIWDPRVRPVPGGEA
ncbi:hypothetical protein C1H76_6676 [Elsinoe australis]|uniref:Uncharacterized protein n=1 Tax=Elsinoe australis TaxID=40998 RepID=A0A4U7AVC8_9PEZI|nr:hypothetical protein C1H76_6676 [Elsinoe australis]